MIRSELVARVAAQNPHLHAWEVEQVVGAILDTVSDALMNGDRVELRGFGMFSIKKTAARIGRDPRTGKQLNVPARAHVRFRPGRTMQTRLNHEKADPEQEVDRLLRAP